MNLAFARSSFGMVILVSVTALAGLTVPITSPAQAPDPTKPPPQPPAPAADPAPVPAPPADMTAEELYNSGQTAFAKGDYAQAEAFYSSFLEEYGANEEAKKAVLQIKPRLALCLVQAHKFAEALELGKECLDFPNLEPALAEELTFWMGICQMQAKDYPASRQSLEAFFRRFPKSPKAAEAKLLFATTHMLEREHDRAVSALTSLRDQLKHEVRGRVVVLLLFTLLEKRDHEAALELLKEEYPRMDGIVQLVSFQSLALRLGSRFLEERKFRESIACLQRIWRRERLRNHQTGRLDTLRTRLETARARPRLRHHVFQLEALERKVLRELEQFEKIPSFDAALRLRLATAFMGMERYREAAIVLEDMLRNMPADAIVEQASVNLARCWMEIERWPKAIEAVEIYLEKFAEWEDKTNLPLVWFLKAQALEKSGQLAEATRGYELVVDRFPESPTAPKALFMKGFTLLLRDRNKEAEKMFTLLRKRYADSPLVDNCAYWIGMAASFEKEHARARKLMAGYLVDFPGGRHKVDAVFRHAFSTHGLAEYEDGIAELQSFLGKFPGTRYEAEALLLLGDAFLAVGKIEDGIAAYKRIDPAEKKFFEEAWFKVGKALRATEEVDEMRAHFEQFVSGHPGSSRMAEAVYWIGWTHHARDEPEKAREIYWKTIRELGDDPANHGVEDILVSLPRLYKGEAERRQLDTETKALLVEAQSSQKQTLALRALWARAKFREKSAPIIASASLRAAADKADVRVHSPRLLADIADALRENTDFEKALALYKGLRKWNPRAIERDRAYAGLGFIAAASGTPDEALTWFDKFEQHAVQSPLLGDVLLAKAEILRGQKKRIAARETLKKLTEDKQAPTQSRARALFLAGETFMDEGSKDATRKATAYYERIYVAYNKFPALAAKAYLRRGEALEELELAREAAEVYRELSERKDLADFPESRTGRERAIRLEASLEETPEP